MSGSSLIARRLRLLVDVPAYWFRAAARRGFHPFAAARSVTAALGRGFRPEEAWRLGLLLPHADARTAPHLVSRYAFTRFLKTVNPVSWEPVLSDKGIFARLCAAAALPTPALHGIFFRNGPGWTPDGRHPRTRAEWEEYLAHHIPAPFVVKPSRGAYGDGIRVIRRTGTMLEQEGRGPLAAGLLCREMAEDPVYDGFVLQGHVVNHPDVRALSGLSGLQTCRIMTALPPGGGADVLYAFLRVKTEEGPTDNFRSGTAGVVLARIDLEDGAIHSCWTYDPGGGVVETCRHPLTGKAFRGYRLPDWGNAMALARRAAHVFAPIRTIGWDIALTDGGPLVIEGNIWYDPPSHSGMVDRIMERIRG